MTPEEIMFSAECNYGFSPMPPQCHVTHVDCNSSPQYCAPDQPPAHAVPEPGEVLLFSVGLLALFIVRRVMG